MQTKTVFLTGASKGIGQAIFKKLHSEHYHVIAPTRAELNLADPQSVAGFIQKHGDIPVDILINNAGINYPQWIQELTDANINETFQINVISPLKLIRAYTPYMIKHHWGRIINISSIFGVVARGKQTLYSASKHGVNGITKALALELGPHNILVNSVCPGFTNTDLVRRNSSEKNAEIANNIPLKRFAEPEEIAELVAFLISGKNTYIHGASILIDGGFTCG